LNVGREDIDLDGISPCDPRVTILGGSSGYLVVDVSKAEGDIGVGDKLSFSLNYGALLRAMTSEYVKKHTLERGVPPREA
jgi:predicted amino acid racemase